MSTGAELLKDIKNKFSDGIISLEEKAQGRIYCEIKKDILLEVVEYIHKELQGRFLISVGTDHREASASSTRNPKPDYMVSHIFSIDEKGLFLTLHIPLEEHNLNLPSITNIIPGANWAEREFFDMLGITADGHPDPRRLALPDDWPVGVHPLRRDFKYDTRPPAESGVAPVMKEPPPRATVVPIGPFFPVLEEPSQWKVFVEGETVVGCDYRGFYNHRGIEKLGDSHLTYNKIPFVAERICGICGFIHSTNYCQAVEEAAGIEVPLRARYIRSLMLELERIHSHILWTGIAGHILGFDTILHQTWRIREPVMWLCERITGHRKTYGMNIVGGVRHDITPDKYEDILRVISKVEKEWLEVIDAISEDTTLMMRLKGVGILTNEAARAFCTTGPTARGSGVAIDSRTDHPYAAYEFLGVKKIVYPDGDVLARTLVRLEETIESIRLVKKCISDMPEGPIVATVDENIPPHKEGISVVEAPRGEAIHYVITGEENRPYRWRVRAPSYPNLQAIPVMIQGAQLADVPITLGSIDPCFSCTERVEVIDVKKGEVKTFTSEELLELSRNK